MAATVDYNVLPRTTVLLKGLSEIQSISANILPDPTISPHMPIYMNPEQEDIACCICGDVTIEKSKPLICSYYNDTPFACCSDLSCKATICISCVKDSDSKGCRIKRCPICRTADGLITILACETLALNIKQRAIMKRYAEATVSCEKCEFVMCNTKFNTPEHLDYCRFPCPNECGVQITRATSLEHFSSCKRVSCTKCNAVYLMGSEHDRTECIMNQHHQNILRSVLSSLNTTFQEKFQEKSRSDSMRMTNIEEEHQRLKSRLDYHADHSHGQDEQICRAISVTNFHTKRLDSHETVIIEHTEIIKSLTKTRDTQTTEISRLKEENRTQKSDIMKLAAALDDANSRMRRMEQMIESLMPKQQAAAAAAAVASKSGQRITVDDIKAGFIVKGTPVKKYGDDRIGIVTCFCILPKKEQPGSGAGYMKIIIEYEKGGIPYEFIANKQFKLVYA